MTVHDSPFLCCESLGLIHESRLYGDHGHHFLIPYRGPREQSAVQQVMLTQFVCKTASQSRRVPCTADKAFWLIKEDSGRNKDISCTLFIFMEQKTVQ